MRVLYTDEYNNFTLIEATAITKVPEETMVIMTILGGNGILVCDDEKLYDHLNAFLKAHVDDNVINFSEYTFKGLTTRDIISNFLDSL